MTDCLVERDGAVMIIRLNRPDRMNSMGGTLIPEFNAAIDEGRLDDSVRVFVVTGEGRGFCAGADLVPGGWAAAAWAPRTRASPRSIPWVTPAAPFSTSITRASPPSPPSMAPPSAPGSASPARSIYASQATRHASEPSSSSARSAPISASPGSSPGSSGSSRPTTSSTPGGSSAPTKPMRSASSPGSCPTSNSSPRPSPSRTSSRNSHLPPSPLPARPSAAHPTRPSKTSLPSNGGIRRQSLNSAEFQEGVRAFLEKREPDFSQF